MQAYCGENNEEKCGGCGVETVVWVKNDEAGVMWWLWWVWGRGGRGVVGVVMSREGQSLLHHLPPGVRHEQVFPGKRPELGH